MTAVDPGLLSTAGAPVPGRQHQLRIRVGGEALEYPSNQSIDNDVILPFLYFCGS